MRTQGFTLIELLIVVAIIGIIAAIAIPNLLISLQKGNQKSTMADMTSLGTAIESYIVDWGMAPAPGGTLITDLDENWFKPFYIKVLPLQDYWGTIFAYEASTDQYSVTSYGRNRTNDNLPPGQYPVTSLQDFNKDIVYANGRFIVFPLVKR